MQQLNKETAAWLDNNKDILNRSALERVFGIPQWTLKAYYASGYVPPQWVAAIEAGVEQFIFPDKKFWQMTIKKVFAEWRDAVAKARKRNSRTHIEDNAKHEQILDGIVMFYGICKKQKPLLAIVIKNEALKQDHAAMGELFK